MNETRIAYTQGTFDLFHVGHLRLLQKAKCLCDKLIVGVNSDELVRSYKGKNTVISAEQRIEIVQALRIVDDAHIVHSLDKVEAYRRFGFNLMVIGDDWKGNERWIQTEHDLAAFGVKVYYLPYTKSISSTKLAAVLKQLEEGYDYA